MKQEREPIALMGLQMEGRKKRGKEGAHRKSKTAFKVGKKNHPLASLRFGRNLTGGETAIHLQWNASGGAEPLHLFGGNLRAFPATTLAGGDLLLLSAISAVAGVHESGRICLLLGKERLGTTRTRAGMARRKGQSQR